MKKHILPILALVTAAGALLFSFLTLQKLDARILELEDSNASLAAQVEAMSARLDSFFVEPSVTDVADWTLTPTAWPDGNGADVTLTMVPTEHHEDVLVRFAVQMEQQPMADVFCDWNGTAYTATVSLPAMNGYSYYCILEEAGEIRTQTLTSPDAPTVWNAVYMEDALNHYCNLWLDSWDWAENTLTIHSALAQIQLAQLPNAGDSPDMQPEVNVILTHNGETAHRSALEVYPGEGFRSYEGELTNFSLTLPPLSDADTVSLWLEVLCGSQAMTFCAAEWYPENGQLMLAAG